MILVAGLSPAWQRIMQFDRFEPGGVNRARDVQCCASGKVINVALALRHLGAKCEAVTVLGGTPGKEIEAEFAELNLPLSVVGLPLPTRVCTTILDAATGETTELVENAGPITSVIVDQFRDAFFERAANADWIIGTGSLAPGTPKTIFRELIAERGERAILDIRGPELLAALECKPLLVKPNRHELEQTLGRALESDNELLQAMQELRKRGAQWVVITDGTGSLRIAGPDGFWQATPVQVKTVNPIGCGDCFTAGVATRLESGDSMLEAIRYGVAAAADNAAQLLPGRLDLGRVAKLAKQVRIEEFG
jgi:1-phosphofructokinase family hexose kinase